MLEQQAGQVEEGVEHRLAVSLANTLADRYAVTPEIAAHVLDFYGEEGGIPPGDFRQKLFAAAAHADGVNLAALTSAFPDVIGAWSVAKHQDRGIAALKIIAGVVSA